LTTQNDHIWRALASPQRRAILAVLRDGPKTTTYLVDQFPSLTRFAVMKHIALLREVGLIRTKEEGRRKINSLNALTLRLVYDELVDGYQDLWARQLLSVKRHAESAVVEDE
jgi:DNA-binding transcriptional ArsR family regulator